MNSAQINPETSMDHLGLRDDVCAYAEQKLFCVFQDCGVEHLMDRMKLRALSGIQTTTALYIRGAPDAWIASTNTKVKDAAQVEFKSRVGNHTNMALEAQPLASAILRSRPPLNINVLYCYRDSQLGLDVGFWCADPPPIDRLFLGSKDRDIHGYIRRAFPHAAVHDADSANGSGDSFVTVSESEWQKLPDWRHLLNVWVAGF